MLNAVIYLPSQFYSTAASIAAESLLAMNAVRGEETFKVHFVSRTKTAATKMGIAFPLSKVDGLKIDILIVLAGHAVDLSLLESELEEEAKFAKRVFERALKSNAVIAGTCSAALLMAKAGILTGKRATVAWWAKDLARELFPKVKWDASRIIIRQGNIFTSGGVLTAFDLMTTVLIRLGYSRDVRTIRKLLVAPPGRHLQSVYEIDFGLFPQNDFEIRLFELVAKVGLANLDLTSMASGLGCSSKTLARRFESELKMTPGKWMQARRISKARDLLETTTRSLADICVEVGYQDPASFSRLFSGVVGTTPSEFRKQTRF